MKIAIIVQARLGSTRLPNKILMNVGGKPLLEFMIERLKSVGKEIIVATPDKEIADFCEDINIPCFVGSEDNVLDRYLKCATKFNVDVIVRVCAACPLIDSSGVYDLIEAYKENPDADLIHNKHRNGPPFGTGAELFPTNVIERIVKTPHNKSHEEHVITYVFENPEEFKILKLDAPEGLKRPNYFFTVDYPEDIIFINAILRKTKDSSLTSLVELLDNNADLAKMNSHLHEGFRR